MHSKTSYAKGIFAETLARMYLRMHGFRILSNRYITGRNTNRAEIDIIAKRKNLVIFVEVKCHKTTESAWASIGPAQRGRLRRAAESYLGKTKWTGDARYDVILVQGFKIIWIKNAI